MQSAKNTAVKRQSSAFHRKLPADTISKAFTVMFLSLIVVCTGTFLMCVLEPEYSFIQNLFEVTSAFGTVGLSTGITPELGAAGKLLLTAIMFIGRLGALTLMSMWVFRPTSNVRYTEESITIG